MLCFGFLSEDVQIIVLQRRRGGSRLGGRLFLRQDAEDDASVRALALVAGNVGHAEFLLVILALFR